MSDSRAPDKQTAGLLPEDENKNPAFRLSYTVTGFVLLVWTGVLLLVLCLVFHLRFA